MARTAIIVDDHPMCRRATAMAFQAVDPAVTLVESDTLEDARRLAATADMVAMDIAMPGSRGMIGLAEFREEFPDVPLLIISGNSNPDIEREVSGIGANGFLSKEMMLEEAWKKRRSNQCNLPLGVPPQPRAQPQGGPLGLLGAWGMFRVRSRMQAVRLFPKVGNLVPPKIALFAAQPPSTMM